MMIEEDGMDTVAYSSLELSAGMARAIEKKGYVEATAVQSAAIPPLMDWADVIAKAPTGTGKTFAFGIPMIEHIDPEGVDLQGIVLAPTRELALQIRDEFRDLCVYKPGVRVCCLYGGQEIKKQIVQLKKQPQVIVATPGRLYDHIKRHTVKLDTVETVVLDEADRMLDMGFIKDVMKLLDMMVNRKNLAMFSATMSREVMDISWVYQREPVEITVEAREENRPDIRQFRVNVPREKKLEMLKSVMTASDFERMFVFCNTKNMADRLNSLLGQSGISSMVIHGDIPQKLRVGALSQFKKGELRVLVATDVAARGLDIDDVDAVFNYDVPDELEYYVHRIGRTGRAKRSGVAYSFVADISEGIRLDEIEKNTGMKIVSVEVDGNGNIKNS